MIYYPEDFKERTENLINNSFIPLVLGIKSDIKKVNINYLSSLEIEKILKNRVMYLENIISSGWLSRKNMENTFYNLWLELEEAKTLLEEHQRNMSIGNYFS